jgi:hypothetical protein
VAYGNLITKAFGSVKKSRDQRPPSRPMPLGGVTFAWRGGGVVGPPEAPSSFRGGELAEFRSINSTGSRTLPWGGSPPELAVSSAASSKPAAHRPSSRCEIRTVVSGDLVDPRRSLRVDEFPRGRVQDARHRARVHARRLCHIFERCPLSHAAQA